MCMKRLKSNVHLRNLQTRSQGLLSTSDWLRQITWLWNEGTGGSALRRGPPDPSIKGTPHVICLSQSESIWVEMRGLGVPSIEGSRGPLICSIFWACDWLRQITWGVYSHEGTPWTPHFTKFLTFDSISTSDWWIRCAKNKFHLLEKLGTEFIPSNVHLIAIQSPSDGHPMWFGVNGPLCSGSRNLKLKAPPRPIGLYLKPPPPPGVCPPPPPSSLKLVIKKDYLLRCLLILYTCFLFPPPPPASLSRINYFNEVFGN